MKDISDGPYTLQHDIIVDEMGLKRDMFNVCVTQPDGSRIHYPIMGPLKATNYSINSSVSDLTQPYTEQDLRDLLAEAISNINQ